MADQELTAELRVYRARCMAAFAAGTGLDGEALLTRSHERVNGCLRPEEEEWARVFSAFPRPDYMAWEYASWLSIPWLVEIPTKQGG